LHIHETTTDKEAQQEAAKAKHEEVNVDNNHHHDEHRALTESHSHHGWHQSHGEGFKFVNPFNDHDDHHNDHHGHSHNGWHNGGFSNDGLHDLNGDTDITDLDGVHGVSVDDLHHNGLIDDADHLIGDTHFSDVDGINSVEP
jgi:hypothetical protein